MRKNRLTLAKTFKYNVGLVMKTIAKEKDMFDFDKEYEKHVEAVKEEAERKVKEEEKLQY